MNDALVIGASGGIAQALIRKLLKDSTGKVFAVSSKAVQPLMENADPRLEWLQCDYSENQIESLCRKFIQEKQKFSYVFICNGVLHSDSILPEKRLEDLNESAVIDLFRANTVVPSLWIKNLLPVLCLTDRTLMTIFSARVGSISDNQLGGWYAYRCSKAALNMFVKTASIEYARRAKNVSMILFHPGTVDTALSKPFQERVPKKNLFKAELVTEKLMSILDSVEKGAPIKFYDWAGKEVPW